MPKRISSSDDASVISIYGNKRSGYYISINDSMCAQQIAVTCFELELLYKTLKKFYETKSTKTKKHKETQKRG